MPALENIGKTACWTEPSRPSAELLAKLPVGQLSAKAGGDIKERITLLRREKVTKPTIFDVTGTCGLGAGAAKTMEAICVPITTRRRLWRSATMPPIGAMMKTGIWLAKPTVPSKKAEPVMR